MTRCLSVSWDKAHFHVPVDEETSVTFSCLIRKHVIVGSNTATCQGGLLERAQPHRSLKTGSLEKNMFSYN